MQAHLILKERGTDGDLKCILRGISEDMPKKVQAVQAAHEREMSVVALTGQQGGALARQLRETPLSTDMQLTAQEHGHRVRATVSDGWPLRWWLLSQGDGVVVEQPEGLREEIGKMLSNAAAQYQNP